MANDKIKWVEVKNQNPSISNQTLEISHAERLLKMPNNGGWELADKTNKFDPKDGIIKNTNTGSTRATDQ